MNINISREMTQAVIAALRGHIKTNGLQSFGKKDEYQVTNEEALEFFEIVLNQDNPVHKISKDGLTQTFQWKKNPDSI